jgi:putative ATPase
VEDVQAALGSTSVRYGVDDHYDVASAFIKSIRGSDPDAALHWLARMLAAGEDPRFIARRIVISASEDIGLADPTGLLVADAAARAVEFVGLPEARINLAHATVHLALAEKSNTAYAGLNAAESDIRDRPLGEVPIHLRDASYKSAAKLGHGDGYDYPHSEPAGWVSQQYMPEELASRTYYRPATHGREPQLVDSWRRRKGATTQQQEDSS